jgi:hypothetical protein
VRRIGLVVVGASLQVGVVFAEEPPEATVQDLLTDCEEYTEDRGGSGGMFCLGMVAGANVVLALNCESAKNGQSPNRASAWGYCRPSARELRLT